MTRQAVPAFDPTRLRVDLGEQVVGFFPAPSAAFDRHRSGALEDITGASHPDGEPPVFGTP
jgi:hypothetical protein